MGKLQKLDNRIQVMLHSGVDENHRTLLVIVGDRGQDQVPTLYQIQSAVTKRGLLKVLWCYKKELSFSTHRKRNLKLLNKRRKAGIVSEGTVFEQFICSTDIRWCYYHETHKILGQTFDMCILQDFEALTPNTLARTIETVAGGGLVVFLLKSMDSLRQLCTMAMDVHARYRTEAHVDVVCRFNERFLLSLAHNPRCIVLDDRWNILPISKTVINNLGSVPSSTHKEFISKEQEELSKLKLLLSEDGSYFAPLVTLCRTLDQAKSLLQFCSALLDVTNSFENSKANSEKKGPLDDKLKPFDSSTQNLISTLWGDDTSRRARSSKASSAVVVMTAARGRGKSAALGLGLAAAFDAGLPNMCVTAPSPENLLTLMQFVLLGLKALKYEEHVDFTVFRSTDVEHNKAVVRVEVRRRNYRQTLIYLPPWEAAVAVGTSWQPDLFCIDEAAAIPLPSVRQMITGPKLVFMASTVNGYEGTGRSLSVKLIQQLRSECKRVEASSVLSKQRANDTNIGKSLSLVNNSRLLYEITLVEAIRYAYGDPVETWLNNLLCLNCGDNLTTDGNSKTVGICPSPDLCQLYYVNRDTLFAYHSSTEVFLQRLMALYVSSHYKNSPNDLQLLSDAPAHHIFCLLAPYDPTSGRVPEILCVLQVCLEGRINRDIVMRGLARGLKPSGDLIPWTISQQFCEPNFGELSGARVVRIATHPDYQGLGYGSRALKLLQDYYMGKIAVTNLPTAQLTSKDSPKKKSKQAWAEKVSNEDDENECEPDEEEEEEEEIPDDLSISSDELPAAKKSKYEGAKDTTGSSKLLTEKVERRGSSSLPPLLSRLCERKPEKLNYLGVSFGATPKLIRFWKKAGYLPVYLRQTMNDLTGEFSCIMLSELRHDGKEGVDVDWLKEFYFDFCRRFIKLLPGPFRQLDAVYALELLSSKAARSWSFTEANGTELRHLFSELDMERLHRYLRSLLDFPMVSDQLPELATLYFLHRFPDVRLNKTQQVILVGLGLQRKSAEQLSGELEKLLGAEGTGSISQSRSDEGSAWQVKQQNREAKRPKLTSGADQEAAPLFGWARRIRGLLFVTMRELVRSLDETLKADGTQPASQFQSLLKKGNVNASLAADAASSSSDVEMEEAAEEDEDEEQDVETNNEEDAEAEEEQETPADGLDEEEKERRAAAVRQLLLEQNDSELSKYEVKGSDEKWQAAVAGHGSELSALRIRVPADEQQMPRRHGREPLVERAERRKQLRLGQTDVGPSKAQRRKTPKFRRK